MNPKLFNFVVLTLFVVNFISCSKDDDPVTGNKSDLIGTYNGNESIYLTDIKKDTIRTTVTARFEQYVKDANQLSVSVSDLGSGILASNFRITKDAYSFNIDKITLMGLTGDQIPSYVTNWFTGPGKEYDSIDKIDLVLFVTTGQFDRNTNKMQFKYSGTLTIYPYIGGVAQGQKRYLIAHEYFNLVK